MACQGPIAKTVGTDADSQTLADARACDSGDIFACTNVADALIVRDAEGDLAVALQLLAHSCEAGAHLACLRSAEFLPLDEAELLLNRTCSSGDSVACELLADRVRADDPVRAYGLLGLACEGPLFRACHQQGLMLQVGEGVSADPEAAFALFRDLCASGGAEGCRENAKEMLEPTSPHADPQTAEILAQRACAGGDGEGCWLAAEIAAQTPDSPTNDADVFRRRACEFGYPENCEL